MRQERPPILSNDKIAPDTYRIAFQSPQLARDTLPGQFFHVRVADQTDPLLRRPLSMHRRYTDTGRIELLYKIKGRGTQLLSRRRPGECLDILGPLGNGFPSPDGDTYLIAGGMGVAPFGAVIQDASSHGSVDRLTLLIGARTHSALLCVEDFRSMGTRLEIATEDGSDGHRGLVSHLLNRLPAPQTIFCCGPAAMARSIVRYALHNAVACYASVEERMGCGVGICRACVIALSSETGPYYGRVCTDGPVFTALQLAAWASDEKEI